MGDKQLKREAKTRATRTQMTAEEHNKMTDDRREKRRLQEMKRRLEKRAIVEKNGGYPPRGGANRKGLGEVSRKESNCSSRCSACGELGHMKTNRKCPKYHISEEELHVYSNVGVAIEGTQITLSSARMDTAKAKRDEAACPTLKFDFSRLQKAEKKKRRRDELESGVEYVAPTKQTARSRRMTKNPEIVLANYLDAVYVKLSDCREADVFKTPVNLKAFPLYLKLIEPNTPMDLKKIRDNIRDHVYRDSASCMKDLAMMVENCEKFNGPNSHFSLQGRALMETAQKELAKVAAEVQDVELKINGAAAEGS